MRSTAVCQTRWPRGRRGEIEAREGPADKKPITVSGKSAGSVKVVSSKATHR